MFHYFRSDMILRVKTIENCVKFQEEYLTELTKTIKQAMDKEEKEILKSRTDQLETKLKLKANQKDKP